jgi:addiction module HigA family antidote
MLTTKRKPASVGEILTLEFMAPVGLTQGALAKAMGVQRKPINELCNDRREVTAPTALILAQVFGNSGRFLAQRAAAPRSMGSRKRPHLIRSPRQLILRKPSLRIMHVDLMRQHGSPPPQHQIGHVRPSTRREGWRQDA